MTKEHVEWRQHSATGLILIGVLVLACASMITAQGFSPYSDFQSMSLNDLRTLQVKLTYIGPQQEPNPSVLFTSSFNTVDPSKFVPFRRPGINYSNDDHDLRTFSTTAEELQAVVQNVGTLPNVTAGGATGDFLSFGLLNTAGSTKAFEALLNKADSSDLLSKLRLALQANKKGLQTLSDFGCSLELLEPGRPADATSQVSVNVGGVRLNRSTGRYVATATVTNNSADLSGPLSLVVDVTGGVSLFNGDGVTCATTPVGRSFINLPLTNNTLPSGGSATVTLEFVNPNSQPIKVTTKVLAGPGAR